MNTTLDITRRNTQRELKRIKQKLESWYHIRSKPGTQLFKPNSSSTCAISCPCSRQWKRWVMLHSWHPVLQLLFPLCSSFSSSRWLLSFLLPSPVLLVPFVDFLSFCSFFNIMSYEIPLLNLYGSQSWLDVFLWSQNICGYILFPFHFFWLFVILSFYIYAHTYI